MYDVIRYNEIEVMLDIVSINQNDTRKTIHKKLQLYIEGSQNVRE